MTVIATKQNKEAERQVQVMLTGARVTSGFRNALFSAAARSGMSVNEFVLRAAGEALARSGANFPGVFERGDITPTNDNLQQGVFLHG